MQDASRKTAARAARAPLKGLFAASVVVFAGAAFAKDATLIVICGDCGRYQGIEVELDGAPAHAGHDTAKVQAQVSPGKHQVRVYKWLNAFSREELGTKVFKFRPGRVVRVKASAGELAVLRKGKAVSPPTEGPSPEAINTAAGLIAEAREYLKEASEINREESSGCQSRVNAKLAVVRSRIRDLRESVSERLIADAKVKAKQAKRVIAHQCPRRVQKALNKKVEKVVARLDKASAALR